MTCKRLAIALLATFAATAPATATTVGSASTATLRKCDLVTAAQACDGGGPGQSVSRGNQLYGGGVGVGGWTNLTVGPNRAWSFVEFEAAHDLPTIRAATEAVDNVRININTIAFQSYVWGGDAGGDFSITGNLHIVDSSTSANGGTFPGGARFSSYVGIWDPSVIAGLSTPQELLTELFYRPCGGAGILGSGSSSGDLTGGSANFTATTSACSNGSLFLTPGQEVLVVAGLQIPVNRGGFADSSATFTTGLGADLTVEQIAVVEESLVSAISKGANVTSVPEPSSWAMLIAGFGVVGVAMRRRPALVQTKL